MYSFCDFNLVYMDELYITVHALLSVVVQSYSSSMKRSVPLNIMKGLSGAFE